MDMHPSWLPRRGGLKWMMAGALAAMSVSAHSAADLGPNVIVFDPAMGTAAIQAKLDQVFSQQETNQFGQQRYALLFKPGHYTVNANVGFYTAVSGLGQHPKDVAIDAVTVDAGWFGGNATQNFWRSVENLSVTPIDGGTRWAVAQAAPMRRLWVKGNLNLSPTNYGWASGGYIADSKVDAQVQPYSQQQWFTRDSQIGSWLNGVWNMVFTGVIGAPANSFPNPVYTTIEKSPITREKPYLYLNAAGEYEVFVPDLRTASSGTTWGVGGQQTPGKSVPLTKFYVAKPGVTAAQLNAQLDAGKHLLFTPGIYRLDQTLQVKKANTIVMGLGYATLIPDNGVTAMKVADVDGVKIASVLFDAGPVKSPLLLQLGPKKSEGSHADNPTSVQDVFFRIGGAGPGKATTSLEVNSDNVLIDHVWAWRADHGTGVGWTVNPAATGVVVNGKNVTAYGLFVEHYQKYQVRWNGNGGRTYFFQNEMPYDPPTQAAWRTGAKGYAAYKVGDKVTSHEAWGLGSYCYFNVNPDIHADRGFEVPDVAGVKLHSLSTVSLGGVGVIDRVINNTGAPAQGQNTVPSTVTTYP